MTNHDGNYFVKSIDYKKFYNDVVLKEFQQIFTYDDFSKNLFLILHYIPNNIMPKRLKNLIYQRYIFSKTVSECCKHENVTVGYFYYWVGKATEIFERYITSTLLTTPLSIALLKLDIERGIHFDTLFNAIIVKRIGVAEFIFSNQNNDYHIKRSKIKATYPDGSTPSYSRLISGDEDIKMCSQDQINAYNSIISNLISYMVSDEGEWLVDMVRLFEKDKPFYKEFVSLLNKRFIYKK